MGIRRIDSILEQFGFGNLTGIDLDNELSGNVPSPEWKKQTKGVSWYEGDTVISAIGQGYFQATPIQLASAVATLANRGKRFMPYLMLREQQPGMAMVEQTPTALEPVVLANEEYWNIVIDAMEDVVETPQGTAYRFGRQHNYTVAAKTGTAQVIARRGNNGDNEDLQNQIPERLRDHHLFIAFAPVDHPQIALGIITENSSFAIETARALLDYYLGKQQNANRPNSATNKTDIH
jgi:penicillin-binding protein 2